MKYFAIICVLVLQLVLPVNAKSQETSLFQTADSAYNADEFGMAIDFYQEILRTQGSSPQILYNLGNAYYRSGNTGMAVVSYERALRLDPSFKDAQFNLQFVQSKLVDRQRADNSVFGTFLNKVLSCFTSNVWAWLGAVTFMCFIALVALYMYASPILLRKIGFFGSIAAFFLAVILIVIAWIGASRMSSHNQGVVTSPSVILSTSPRVPRDRNEEVALLHEGSELRIIDSLTTSTDSTNVRMWYKVEIDDDHKGWAPASSLEII